MPGEFNIEKDSYVWNSLKSGDRKALAWIYKQYFDGLLRYGLTLTSDKELVRDCIQELFIICWRQRERLADVHDIRSYLLISLKRLLLRDLKRMRTLSDRIAGMREMEYVHSHEHILQEREDRNTERRLLLLAIGQLPKRQREAVFLRFYQELDYREMAGIINLNYQGARNIIYKSVKSLRKNFLLTFRN